MKISFPKLALFTSISFSVLAAVWMFIPEHSLALWGVGFNTEADFVSRRASALYAGIALMFFLARNSEPSAARRAITVGTAFTCLLLAGLGTLELINGRAHLGICGAIVLEVVLSIALLFVDRSGS